MEFSRDTLCELCPLHLSATSPCIPTRELAVSGKEITVLVVGEAPGKNEDRQGKSWVGYAGGLLTRLLEVAGVADYADIYLSNANRCCPPQKHAPSASEIKACRPFLTVDIELLKKQYKEVVILSCGAPAAESLAQIKTLNLALRQQGVKVDGCTTFFTFHPAMLHPSRKPALIHAVGAHLILLQRYLKGEFVPHKIQVVPEIGMVPPFPSDLSVPIVALDIETYGILKTHTAQSVFHPIKSKLIDGVELDHQIITVSIGYKTPDGTVHTGLYKFEDPIHRHILYAWFKWIVANKITLLGQNIKFDLLYLLLCDPLFREWINPCDLVVDDTLLVGFLLYEQQPERGLKEMVKLYGIDSYIGIEGEHAGLAKNSDDPDLHQLNCRDVYRTLVLYFDLFDRIKQRFGEGSNKLKPHCQWMRNAVIWDVLAMECVGCRMDIKKLEGVSEQYTKVCDDCRAELCFDDVIVDGEGSDASLRKAVKEGLEACGLINDHRVILTDEKREIAIKTANLNLILAYLPEGEIKHRIELIKKHRKHSKVISTYLVPLMERPAKGIVQTNGHGRGIVYPSWYPIPSYSTRGAGEEETSGGTIQGRVTCRQPPLQTQPPVIRECITTIDDSRMLVVYDLDQIELRMAALLSGDPLFMEAFTKGIDLHTQTALTIFPDADPTRKDWKESKERQCGKKLNFLVLYKGGARKFQEVVRQEVGLELRIEFCAEAIRRWYSRHSVFGKWQEELIQTASQQGYIELPTGWSRTFGLTKANNDIYINEICNFPIQTLSAQILQAGHFEILYETRKRRLRGLIGLQIYDSLWCDIPRSEIEEMDALVGERLTNNFILDILYDKTGRCVPVTYSKKVINV